MKILCVDFDGVIHSYESGWKGVDVIPDGPVPGAFAWLEQMVFHKDYDVAIYSSRSKSRDGIEAMKKWLADHMLAPDVIREISFPTQKPPAYLTIDDRAICFRGTFPSVTEMNNFKAWNK